MIKSLLGICSVGNGHISRQRLIIKQLLKYNINLLLVISQSSYDLFNTEFPNIKKITVSRPWIVCDSMGIDFESTKIKYMEYGMDLFEKFLDFSISVRKKFCGENPDYILTDYEPYVDQFAYCSTGMINPLQVRPSPRDDEQEKDADRLYRDEGYGMNALALHMKNLEIFFSLYIPSLTDMHKAVLKKCLVELYRQFDITWDTDIVGLKPQDFPIFADLYKLVKGKANTEQDRQAYADLALLLCDIAEGSDSFIWNGHSTITNDSIKRTISTSSLIVGSR